MDAARTDHDKKATVGINATDDVDGFIAAGEDGGLGCWSLADLVLEEVWWREGGHAPDAEVFCSGAVTHVGVGHEELVGLISHWI